MATKARFYRTAFAVFIICGVVAIAGGLWLAASGGTPDAGRLPPLVTGSAEGDWAGAEAGPLAVGDNLYFCAPHDLVVSLDAATGAENWRFDPKHLAGVRNLVCGGIVYDNDARAWQAARTLGPDCVARLFVPLADGRLIALSARTGQLCPAGLARGGATAADPSFAVPAGLIRALDVATGRLWNRDGAPGDIAPIGTSWPADC